MKKHWRLGLERFAGSTDKEGGEGGKSEKQNVNFRVMSLLMVRFIFSPLFYLQVFAVKRLG